MAYDYAKHFREITLTQDLTTMPSERTWRLTAPGREPERHQIVLYLGCNVLRTSHMIQTVTAIFDRLGLDYVAVGGPTYCCGIVHHQQGDTAAAGGKNRHTLELFKRYEPEEVVMWCPSCIYFYDEVQQVEMPFPVRHAAEFLAAQLPKLTFSQRVESRVALHYHGVSEPRRREGLAGRRLLESVPGLHFVELPPDPRLGRMCTAAVQAQLGMENWNGIVREQIDQARAAGATTLATIYHGCQRLLCGFESVSDVVIEHYLSVFARALGIEFEDKFKTYRLWQDPERVLADATPCQQANGVDPARASELIHATFGAFSPTTERPSIPS